MPGLLPSTPTPVSQRGDLTDPATYAPRICYGAAVLDHVWPGWFHDVATDRLAMESCDDCMFGQLYGGYSFGNWFVNWQLPDTYLFSAAMHGFTLFDDEQYLEYDEAGIITNQAEVEARFAALADAWRQEIAGRKAAAGCPGSVTRAETV